MQQIAAGGLWDVNDNMMAAHKMLHNKRFIDTVALC
jgi:hypothetical protein